jgi:hypothetical protein
MSFKSQLLPRRSRYFRGQRWVNIGLRTLHLIGIAGLGAGFLYVGVDQSWRLYLLLTLLSGTGLILISIWNNGIWLLQLRGQAVLLKLLLLGLIPLWPGLKLPLFIGVLLISGLISHAPANVRYYSLYHRRCI